jgi:hypothetical protein
MSDQFIISDLAPVDSYPVEHCQLDPELCASDQKHFGQECAPLSEMIDCVIKFLKEYGAPQFMNNEYVEQEKNNMMTVHLHRIKPTDDTETLTLYIAHHCTDSKKCINRSEKLSGSTLIKKYDNKFVASSESVELMYKLYNRLKYYEKNGDFSQFNGSVYLTGCAFDKSCNNPSDRLNGYNIHDYDDRCKLEKKYIEYIDYYNRINQTMTTTTNETYDHSTHRQQIEHIMDNQQNDLRDNLDKNDKICATTVFGIGIIGVFCYNFFQQIPELIWG